MERDFLSLCSNQQINNEDSGFTKVLAVKWPYFNKVSAHPYSKPFNGSEEDKAKMTSGIHFSMNPYPIHHDVHRPHDAKMISVSNQAAGHPFLKNHFASVGQNMSGANVKQPILAGSPLTAPHSVLPRIGAVAGLVEPCVKPSAPAPPQLTIFYAGTVNIFKDITPEKVQAIMLLAGNSVSAASNMGQSEVQAPSSKFASDDDGVPMSPPVNIPPFSAISSPLSVSSHTGPQSGSGSVCSDEFQTAKTSSGPTPTTSASKVETPKVVNATTMFPSAIPQARKASLARFLEKRKERVTSAAPYNLNKKSEDAPSLNSMAANISATTGTSTAL